MNTNEVATMKKREHKGNNSPQEEGNDKLAISDMDEGIRIIFGD